MIRNTPYLSLDLELNGPDIIQVGVAVGSQDVKLVIDRVLP